MTDEYSAEFEEVRKLAIEISRTHLDDVDEKIVGGVLGALVANYLAGHRPKEWRDTTWDHFKAMVEGLVGVADKRRAERERKPS